MILKDTMRQKFGFKVSIKRCRKLNVRRLAAQGCIGSAMTIVL